MINLELFNLIPSGDIFATGFLYNSPEGIYMNNEGGLLRWVAVKGFNNDWTIYCHRSYQPINYIKQSGDKIFTEEYIKRCVPCDDSVLKLYRR